MTVRKIYLRMIRKIEIFENLEWWYMQRKGRPPVPYEKQMSPRKDWQLKQYWLRIRSNPFRTNYH